MPPSNTDYLVKEIKISGSFKNWTDPSRNPQGVSGGSEFEMTVVPQDETLYWTPREAEIVSFDVRMRIHLILMADAQNRGVTLPAQAHLSVLKYRERCEKLRAESCMEGRVDWTDSETAPPAIGDLIEGDPTVTLQG
jgi:hypothetical protein